MSLWLFIYLLGIGENRIFNKKKAIFARVEFIREVELLLERTNGSDNLFSD